LLDVEKTLRVKGDYVGKGDVITVIESKIKATGLIFDFDEDFIELEISDPSRVIRFEDENILSLEIVR